MNTIQPFIISRSYIKTKLNSKSIGYILPNGNINFATPQAAYNYAKNRILKALHEEVPYERGIIIMGNTIIEDVKGSECHVDYNTNKRDCYNCIVVHGHPGVATLSKEDALQVIISNLQKCVAINSNGKYSQLSIKNSSKLYENLPRLLKNIISFPRRFVNSIILEHEYNLYNKKLQSKLTKINSNMQAEIQTLINSVDNNTKELLINWCLDTNNKEYRDITRLPLEYQKTFDKFNQFQIFQQRAWRYFWQKNSSRYGLKYESNYT